MGDIDQVTVLLDPPSFVSDARVYGTLSIRIAGANVTGFQSLDSALID